MARKPNPFKGVSTQEVLNVDIETFNSWDKSTLSAAVRRLADTANKRVKSFGDTETPATNYARRTGGKFTTGGKTLNQLRSEFMRAKHFLELKTSTKTGYKKVVEEFKKRVKVDVKGVSDLTPEQMQVFWRVVDMASPAMKQFIKGSENVQEYIFDVFVKNPNLDRDDFYEVLIEQFKKDYDVNIGSNHEYDPSDFYTVE